MSKHTPGPWALATVQTSCGICHKVGPFPWRDDRQNHACIYVDHPSHDGSAPRDQELLANARLIAAAPDLLEAAQNLENDDGSIPNHAWELLQAAVYKATGARK